MRQIEQIGTTGGMSFEHFKKKGINIFYNDFVLF
jgi:hypothetical protein